LASSRQPDPIPEFFVDRGVRKDLAFRLVELSWRIHRISGQFPNDADRVNDPDWMEFGLQRGWLPFHKDGRIVGNPTEREPIELHRSPTFYLDDEQLPIDEVLRRIHMNQSKIYWLAPASWYGCALCGQRSQRTQTTAITRKGLCNDSHLKRFSA
jgi:PIN domain-containing protein